MHFTLTPKGLFRSALALLCLFLFPAKILYAQNSIQPDQLVTTASPNAASLGIFTQFPAAAATGTPGINIPVYELKYRNVTVPIALSYNTNMVKPDVHPGWVGLGWDLSAGGAINRVVNDKPDEIAIFDPYIHYRFNTTQLGYYYNYGFFSGSNWATATNIQSATFDLTNYPNWNTYLHNLPLRTVKDYQPDEFQFSFLGYSGTFYLDETRHWKVRCDEHVTVDFNPADMISFEGAWESGTQKSGFGKFTLTDPHGTRYVFGGSPQSIEFSSSMLSVDVAPLVPKTWHLTQIILQNGETIDFSYERGEEVLQAIYRGDFSQYNTTGQGPDQLTGSLIFPSYLKNIITPVTQITFNRSESVEMQYDASKFTVDYGHWFLNFWNWFDIGGQGQAMANVYDPEFRQSFLPGIGYNYNTPAFGTPPKFYKLDNICVYDRTNTLALKTNFNYVNTASQRLKLGSVIKQGYGNSPIETYSLQYHNDQMLPGYCSNMKDFWGYYNGPATSGQDVYTSLQPSAAYLQAEILDKVIYPTGGYSVFHFEPHTYSQQLSVNRNGPLLAVAPEKIAGGLRIAEVDHYNSDNTIADWIKYKYVGNFSPAASSLISSGIHGGTFTSASGSPFDPYYNGYTKPYFDTMTTEQLAACSNNNGSHIGYSEVTELFSNGSYWSNFFSNFDNGDNMDEAPFVTTGPLPDTRRFTSRAFQRGRLIRQIVYDNNFNPLKDKTIHYAPINQSTEYVRNISTEYTGSVQTSAYTLQGTAFKTYTYAFLPDQVTDIEYHPGQANIVQTHNYIYDPQWLTVQSVATTNSKGQSDETVYLYPPDMVAANRDPNLVYAHMKAANAVNEVVETVHKTGGIQDFLNHREYSEYGASLFRPSSESIQRMNAALKTTGAFTYDSYGNMTRAKKNGVAPACNVYGYGQTLPIAKVENAVETEVFHTNFEEAGASGLAHTGTKYNNGSYYVPFTPPANGRSYQLTYWYRSSGTWHYTIESYSGPHTVLPSGADAIDDVSVYPTDAAITTYTYDSQQNITSNTDSRGNTTYFEYDDYNRLSTVRDQHGNIKTHYCYNYAGQQTDCFVTVPKPAQTIFARLEIGGPIGTQNNVYLHDEYYTTGEFYIRFYSDAACTTPLTITSAMNITLVQDVSYSDYINFYNSTNNLNYNIPANVNSFYIGTLFLSDWNAYFDYDYNETDDYTSFSYNLLLPAGSSNTVIPFIYF
ncbi:RHS repeat protein [Mucilaginibacter mali]|uniref:RHS repeat protein n=1 Tax=Mucilaginibacter mali TaxID=2740462 RepID=A0A7D4UKA5_9SPHI|nr:RHS repeat domain-containing protein [Mucilaginibacter mali]QKJ30322.1 RHS repeat protein [Mucilaginibacter mali]